MARLPTLKNGLELKRAAPPAVKALRVDEWIKGVTAFPF